MAGGPQTNIVTAYDRFHNQATGYTGTVHFSSNDPRATLPADYHFRAKDFGSALFSVTFATAGKRLLTVVDTRTPSLRASLPLTVIPGSATRFDVQAPATAVAGHPFQVTATARDTVGNVAYYAGSVQVTSSDAKASLPATVTFPSTGSGTVTFSVTLKTAGRQTVSVRDPSSPWISAGESGTIVVAG